MKSRAQKLLAALAMLASLSAIFPLSTAFAQGTAFSYQGQLISSGIAASGNYDFRFRLYEDPFGNTQVGGTLLTNGVVVNNGLFITMMDFGAGIFTGSNYWLEVDVRTNNGGSYTDLNPLQAITPTPYAIMAESATNLAGALPAVRLSGTISNANLPTSPIISGTVTAGAFSGNGGGLTGLSSSNLVGNILDAQLPTNTALLDASQTFTAAKTAFGDVGLENANTRYHHLELSGGNSVGYLYGSYAALGDGIHLGYNFYADSNGTNVIPNVGGGTSRISAGYGSVGLYVGGTDQAPSSGVTVTGTGIGYNNSNPQAALDLNPSSGWWGATVVYRAPTGLFATLWAAGIDANGYFGFGTSLASVDGLLPEHAYIDTSGNYHTVSDLRLKRDITNLDGTLDRVLKLRPVSYHLKDGPTNAPLSLGFLAQEVQPLFPEAVGQQPNGTKDLVYSELIPVAIRSIQELNENEKAKDAEIADLKARVERLEQLLQAKQNDE